MTHAMIRDHRTVSVAPPEPPPRSDGVPYRSDLEPVPLRMAHLPIFRGYPVPWFVGWVDGVPEFRAADFEKRTAAIKKHLCWVCGGSLGRYQVFVIGPMCGINRTTAEPPSHRECAVYSARNCPFLSKRQMTRRTNDLPEVRAAAGHSFDRNPGVTLLWTTTYFSLFGDGRGGTLIEVGDPLSVEWYRQGRAATRAEVAHSVETGLPLLEKLCDGKPDDLAELNRRAKGLEALYPAT